MLIAVTREVSPAIGRCELTFVDRLPIDYQLACTQHRAYEQALKRLGCELLTLPAADDMPDCVFIEDTAVVLDELAVITRPGAASRRTERVLTALALNDHRRLETIESPGTLDGGDVLRIGRTLWVGTAGRSNWAGIGQLRTIVEEFGYEVRPVELRDCLHLKSAVTQVAPETLLVNPAWVDPRLFGPLQVVRVDESEAHAANALRVGQGLLMPASFPRTRARLEARGLAVTAVDVSELQKAEGAVTCCSLVFESPDEAA
jgi:dimethylargininase